MTEFIDQYNNLIDTFYQKEVKEKLIESFVEFYGKEYEFKIRNLIDDLVIIRVEANLSISKLEEKISDYYEQVQNQLKKIIPSKETEDCFTIARYLTSLSEEEQQKWIETYPEQRITEEDFIDLKRDFWHYNYFKTLSALKTNDDDKKIIVKSDSRLTEEQKKP